MRTILLTFILLSAYSCKKHHDDDHHVHTGDLRLSISYTADSLKIDAPLDSLILHPSGSYYTVANLSYYISGFRLHSSSGWIEAGKPVLLGFGQDEVASLISDIPSGHYDSVEFLIGLDSNWNKSGKLGTGVKDQQMEWPEFMGGGYHFLKLEGNFSDSAGSGGYAMHLGTSSGLVRHQALPCLLIIPAHAEGTLKLEMNLNEWFRNPHLYSFRQDGNYTMSSPILMKKIADNGHDVFKIK